MIGKGHNWARITLLILFIGGGALLFFNSEGYVIGWSIWPLISEIIEIVALIFLFQKSSSDWYREIKAIKGSSSNYTADTESKIFRKTSVINFGKK